MMTCLDMSTVSGVESMTVFGEILMPSRGGGAAVKPMCLCG